MDSNDNNESSRPLPQRFAEDQEDDNNNNDELIEALLQELAEAEAGEYDHDNLTETLSQEFTLANADISIFTDATAARKATITQSLP